MTQAPPAAPPSPGGLRPHRGVVVLVLGILGILVCAICGVVAWVMANGDLRAMDEGAMDPEGRQLTQVGKILGIVSVAIWAIAILLWLLMFVVLGIGAAAGAAGP